MRKKILRSRSGFEKPESREEAIMQNILGASNVLEPSESNIEEILKSILYNTPYTKEAEFEIEKILLAIKNNGTYDGEHESRDLKILFAILNDLDYTEEAESRIEELFIEWLHQRSSIKVLEGIPPLTFTSLGQPLINYLIEGNTTQSGTPTPDNPVMPEGCGERSANLLSEKYENRSINGLGAFTIDSNFDLWIGEVVAGQIYTISNMHAVYGFFTAKPMPNTGATYNGSREMDTSGTAVVTVPSGCTWIAVRVSHNADNAMLNSGSTALPYEPYGYKIPILSNSTTTPVYLGEVETTRKIKKLVLTGQKTFNELAAGLYRITENGYMRSADTLIGMCSHFGGGYTVAAAPSALQNTISFLVSASGNNYIYFSTSQYLTISDFKSYLAQQYAAGTPVTIWYVLATPETAVVNEPLMRIGDYADTLSKEQAGVEIPTVSGSNTLDVNTTVKPSNIYIEYK